MFALVAFVLFLLAAFGVAAGSVDLVLVALAFWALHFAYGWSPWDRGQRS